MKQIVGYFVIPTKEIIMENNEELNVAEDHEVLKTVERNRPLSSTQLEALHRYFSNLRRHEDTLMRCGRAVSDRIARLGGELAKHLYSLDYIVKQNAKLEYYKSWNYDLEEAKSRNLEIIILAYYQKTNGYPSKRMNLHTTFGRYEDEQWRMFTLRGSHNSDLISDTKATILPNDCVVYAWKSWEVAPPLPVIVNGGES